ncbi:MAG: hypothetical protein ABI812_05960 [Betaproteobacteria bacterium]
MSSFAHITIFTAMPPPRAVPQVFSSRAAARYAARWRRARLHEIAQENEDRIAELERAVAELKRAVDALARSHCAGDRSNTVDVRFRAGTGIDDLP